MVGSEKGVASSCRARNATDGVSGEDRPSNSNGNRFWEDRRAMKLKVIGVLLTLSLLSISCGGSSGKARAAGFSVASLKGSYAGIFSGNIYTGTAHLPFLGTGIFIAD